jgi:hypothetical protein
MKIEITNQVTTGTVKELFNNMFPFLKIEFFKKPHGIKEASGNEIMIKKDMMLGHINEHLTEGSMVINPHMLTVDLEQSFLNRFGLAVQVFRLQKPTWIETTHTDSLSLEEQNEKGRSASEIPGRVPGDRYLEDGQY